MNSMKTFSEEIAGKILSIPLAKDPYDDFMAWCGEPSGEYLVRSAYKLLQASENDTRAHALHTDYSNFYKKNYGYLSYLLKLRLQFGKSLGIIWLHKPICSIESYQLL